MTRPVDPDSIAMAQRTDLARGASQNESAETYGRVVVRLNPKWRVILCRPAIQWILQRYKAWGRHGADWRSVRYLTNRDHLIATCAALSGRVDPAMLSVLATLPGHIGGVVR